MNQNFSDYFDVPLFKHKVVQLQLIILLLCMPLGAYIDGVGVSLSHDYNQWLNNILVTLFTSSIYWVSDAKVRRKMRIMLVVSFFAEVLGTFILKIYAYRLHNIPIYVPIAHVSFYALICHVQKWSIIRQYRQYLKVILFSFVTTLSSVFFIFYGDTGGFICYVMLVSILCTRSCKLYYLLTSFLGLYAERCGTYTQAWAWVTHIQIGTCDLTMGNPPMGVMGLYAFLDLIANNVYFWRYLMRESRSSNDFCAKYVRKRTYSIAFFNQFISHLLTIFFSIEHHVNLIIAGKIMTNFLKNYIHLKRIKMPKKPSTSNSAYVKFQLIAFLHQFLALIDAFLIAIFSRWGYTSFVKQPQRINQPLSTMPQDSLEEMLHSINILRASVANTLDDIENELKKNQNLHTFLSKSIQLPSEEIF